MVSERNSSDEDNEEPILEIPEVRDPRHDKLKRNYLKSLMYGCTAIPAMGTACAVIGHCLDYGWRAGAVTGLVAGGAVAFLNFVDATMSYVRNRRQNG